MNAIATKLGASGTAMGVILNMKSISSPGNSCR